ALQTEASGAVREGAGAGDLNRAETSPRLGFRTLACGVGGSRPRRAAAGGAGAASRHVRRGEDPCECTVRRVALAVPERLRRRLCRPPHGARLCFRAACSRSGRASALTRGASAVPPT